MKKLLSVLLTVALLISVVPFGVFTFTASAATEYTEGYYTYTVENGEATIIGTNANIAGDITIPSTLGGYPITSIGDYAFMQCRKLTSITIPDSVTSIGYSAFEQCTSLTSITIPDSVTSINNCAFYNCIELTSITIPDSVTSIGYSAFERCTSLTSITIPDSVISINDYVFYRCIGLTSITIPDSVTSIGNAAFSGCNSLTSITIPDSVTSVGGSAFADCFSLTSITVPDSFTSIGGGAFANTAYYNNENNWQDEVLYIGDYLIDVKYIFGNYAIKDNTKVIASQAFHNCNTLTSIAIPDSVTSIGYGAFYLCYGLTDVWYTGSEEDMGNISLEGNNENLSHATWHYNVCKTEQHIYSNNYDNYCDICGWDRHVQCVYSNSCDTVCNICNTSRTIIEHSYAECYDGYQENIIGDLEITPEITGIYYFGASHQAKILDSQGNEIKHIDSARGYSPDWHQEVKGGWPLVAGQKYTVLVRGEGDELWAHHYYSCKIADTIFPDTSASGWYNDAVTYAVGAGIMSGYSNGLFGTSDSIQRQDFLVMLARLDGVDLDYYIGYSIFPDVARNSYYEAAVNWGAENGIVTGYNNGKFGVGDKVTREQLVTFLYRYAKHKGYDSGYSSNRENVVSGQYTDYKNVSGFAKEPILWAIEKGVISGKTPTTIAPQGNAQRCEVAKIMYNIYLNDIFS